MYKDACKIISLSDEEIKTLDNLTSYYKDEFSHLYINTAGLGYATLFKEQFEEYTQLNNVKCQISLNRVSLLMLDKFLHKYYDFDKNKLLKNKLNKDIKFVNRYYNKNLELI